MDWSQALYIGLLGLACWTGRPGPWVLLAMWGNLLATMAFADDPMSVAGADLLSFIVLIDLGRRENIVAAIFVAMLPVYLIGHYLELSDAVIYTVIDCMAYVQLGVIGGWDTGMGRTYRRLYGRRLRPDNSAISWRHASVDMAAYQKQDRGK